jgi:DNA-directed RNA polymerase specialized sigma24 family protein
VTLEMTVGDADLIGRSVREPELFTEIFDRYSTEILRYVHARLGGDLAEDVTAETFLAAFRQRSRFDLSAESARPWLYGIAVRQVSKHRRTEARRLRLLRSALADRPAEDIGDRSAERVTAAQLGPRLDRVRAAHRPRPHGVLFRVLVQEPAQGIPSGSACGDHSRHRAGGWLYHPPVGHAAGVSPVHPGRSPARGWKRLRLHLADSAEERRAAAVHAFPAALAVIPFRQRPAALVF